MRWYPAYVGVGSNLGMPAAQVERALTRLGQLPASRLLRRSSLFGSRPLGTLAQPDFVNAAAAILTQLDAAAFFHELRALERALGRAPPREHWGPRVIDLDLLVFADLRLDEPDLTVPHPGIAERNFVLYPLAQIAPQLLVPGAGSVADLAAQVSPAGIWRLDAPLAAS
jgi:2-amino-4-hydroxy-6-hydroxymethyldihydropteridine diphosphokinase